MIKNDAGVVSLLEGFVNSKVIVKMVNGRTISGFLKGEVGNFTIKLGTKHIPLEDVTVRSVVLLP